ncbi:MAG: argonaute/piwi family protein [Candidatus Binataceae bacterium]
MNAPVLIPIGEPRLAFRYGQELEHPKDGLFLFGPLDDRAHPTQLRFGVIGTAACVARFNRWSQRICGFIPSPEPAKAHLFPWPGFEAAFRCKWPEKPIAKLTVDADTLSRTIRIGDRTEAIFKAVEILEKPILEYRSREEAQPAFWFVVIPEEVYLLGRPQSSIPKGERQQGQFPANTNWIRRSTRTGQNLLLPEDREVAEMQRYARNFHNQLKAKLLREKIAVQVVRDTTLTPEDFIKSNGRPLRGTQDPPTVAWNLCTTAFFKGEGKPWKLASVREGVCYIGLVFKQDLTGAGRANACCGAQMFLDSGDGVVFRGAMGPWWSPDRKEYHLSEEAAEQLVRLVVTEYAKRHGAPPRELFIHGRASFNNAEWKGFCATVPETTKLVGVRIRTSYDLKLFRPGTLPIMRGLAHKVTPTRAYLWSTGYVPRLDTYPGWETPNPILVEIVRGESQIETVLADILGLTKLNYNSCEFSASMPVTLSFADAVGEILMAAPSESTPPLPFRYYI